MQQQQVLFSTFCLDVLESAFFNDWKIRIHLTSDCRSCDAAKIVFHRLPGKAIFRSELFIAKEQSRENV
ncbi:MAG: hypothetical protein AAB316_09890 [Bacteroidota bacterium]